MLRPLLTAVFEYFWAYQVLKKGKIQPRTIAAVLFFLATFQLGEVIIFLTNGHYLGFQIAYIATTLLPPLGVLLISQLTGKKYAYPFFQGLAFIFISFMILDPHFVLGFEINSCCISVFDYARPIRHWWPLYYQGTLLFSILLMIYHLMQPTEPQNRSILMRLLIGYLSFDLSALLLAKAGLIDNSTVPSAMCALAFFAAYIFSRISLDMQPCTVEPKTKLQPTPIARHDHSHSENNHR